MAISGGYPTTPLSTAQAIPAGATLATEIAGLEQYSYDDYEIINIGKNRTPLLSTVIAIGRGKAGGEYKNIGLTEEITNNFPAFKFKEEDDMQSVYISTSTVNSSATTVTVASTLGLYEGKVLRNVTTNENIRVASITNSTDFVVRRETGSVAAAQITSGDKLIIIGTAMSKGIAAAGTSGVATVEKENYFQKFITTVELDDFDMMSAKYKTVNQTDKLMTDKSIEHYIEMERTAIYGQKKSFTDANGRQCYTAEGIMTSATRGYADDISSALTRSTLEEVLSAPLNYTKNGATKKIALCGTKAKSKISELFEGRLQVSSIEHIDLKFNSMEIDKGEYQFINHPMMDADNGLDKHMIVIDPAFMKIVYPSGNGLQKGGFNGKTNFEMNKAATTPTHEEGSFYTYMTLAMACPNSG